MTSDVQWQNYLNDVSDAILTGDDVNGIRSRYGISHKDDTELIDLIETLNGSFEVVEPPTQFSARLKDELMGVERRGVVWSIRRLPARVQWAAVVAAIAGILGGVLIVIQRLMGAGNRINSKEHTRIPEEG